MITSLIQLARYGDIVNMLPIAKHFRDQGDEVRVYANGRFADLFEAVSYIDLRVWKGGTIDLAAAEKQARIDGADRVIVTQSNGNPTAPQRDTGNYLTQPWERAGLLDKFHELPLVFDRRDLAGEADAIAKHWPTSGRPVLVYCLNGVSSPFRRGEEVRAVLARSGYELLELPMLPKVHHLLGLIERAAMLVTVDSLPLHLSYAFGTPTIAMSRPERYYASEPRRHWIGQLFYDDAKLGEHLADAIAGNRKIEIARDPASLPEPSMAGVVSWFTESNDRYNRARATWPADTILLPPGRTLHGMPFVRDLIDAGCERAEACILHNADICFTREARWLIREAITRYPCAWANRIDVRPGAGPFTTAQLRRRGHCGTDVFVFSREWWAQHRADWPDMLLGREGWDWIMRRMMRDGGGAMIDSPICWHELHKGAWKIDIYNDPGQQYNRKLGREWAIAHGYERELHPGPYLFK